MKMNNDSFQLLITIGFATILALAGCGGGSSSTPPVVGAVYLKGTVARGAAIANANVTITDVNGKTVTTTSDASGNFSTDITSLTPPLVLVATDPLGVTTPLVSLLVSAPAGSNAPTANITPLTTAVAALLSPNGNPYMLSGNLATLVTAGTVSTAISTLNTALSAILANNNLSTSTFNPISTPFVANGTSADAVIEAISLIPQSSSSTGGIQIVATANPTIALVLSTSTSSPTPLTAPPAAGSSNYASFVQKELSTCLALPISQRGSANSCTAILDTNFLQNGYTSLATAYPDFSLATSVGATVNLPQTIRFYTDSNNNQLSLVRLTYQLNDKTLGEISLVLRNLAQSVTLADSTVINWDIYGNQQKYDASLYSAILRRKFVDNPPVHPGDISHYEAGLQINFNPSGPNASAVNVVKVTGPGLPATGLYLAKSSACGTSSWMPISSLTAVPTTSVTTTSNTGLYRWDWMSLSSATFTPPSGTIWASSPVVASAIPLFSQYTFTLYNSTGTQIDSFIVENNSPPVAASYGTAVHWPTLDSQLVTNFLTPTGSLAAPQSSQSIAWVQDPLGLLERTEAVFNGPTSGTPVTEVDGFAFAPSGLSPVTITAGRSTDYTVTSFCTGAQFPALATGAYRLVELRSQEPSLIKQFDVHQYND